MADDLEQRLRRIDGRGYKAYKDLRGRYPIADFTLHVDHVQGDPFAAPSRLRVRLPRARAGFPEALHAGRSREVALRDFLARAFAREARRASRERGTGASGQIGMDAPGQEVIERSAVRIDEDAVEARFTAGLPARGRRVLAREAMEMLLEDVPAIVHRTLCHASLDGQALRRHVETVEDAGALRAQLAGRGLVAFVADGALLPRRSGVDQRPLGQGALPFRAPASLRVTLERPNGGAIAGLGVPRGVTLIVGGGYHGKSTLLAALARGVYDHLPGDGREAVVADAATVKIRAEDGRAVSGVDISPFIGDLPGGVSTASFTTANASGSTSQAAAIMEALEAGARVLLMDEDTSATNFMIRDRRMQALIARDREPITPYVDKVRRLWEEHGVSTVLVLGGSGDYLDQTDTVIAMQDFAPRDVTAEAREVAAAHRTGRVDESGGRFGGVAARRLPEGVALRAPPGRPLRLKVAGRHAIRAGAESLDLAAVEQLVDASQTRAVARALLALQDAGGRRLGDLLDDVERRLAREGLDALSEVPLGDLAAFRRFELAAAVNRLRGLHAVPEREAED